MANISNFQAIQKGEGVPVDFEEYIYSSLATFCIEESLQKGTPIEVDPKRDLESVI